MDIINLELNIINLELSFKKHELNNFPNQSEELNNITDLVATQMNEMVQ